LVTNGGAAGNSIPLFSTTKPSTRAQSIEERQADNSLTGD
jgi:hypothetical protein